MRIGIRKKGSGIENTSTNTSTEVWDKAPKALNIKAFGENERGPERPNTQSRQLPVTSNYSQLFLRKNEIVSGTILLLEATSAKHFDKHFDSKFVV